MTNKYAKSETYKNLYSEGNSTTYERSIKIYGNDKEKIRTLAEEIKV